jgi:hypothetical protein
VTVRPSDTLGSIFVKPANCADSSTCPALAHSSNDSATEPWSWLADTPVTARLVMR